MNERDVLLQIRDRLDTIIELLEDEPDCDLTGEPFPETDSSQAVVCSEYADSSAIRCLEERYGKKET